MMVRLLIALAVTEAVTEIVVASELFEPVRRVMQRAGKLGALFTCGYCLSVWVGVGVSYLLRIDLGLVHPGVDPLLVGLVVHRASNVLHELISRLLNRHPFQARVFKTVQRVEAPASSPDDAAQR
jgi:hypothetical protein